MQQINFSGPRLNATPFPVIPQLRVSPTTEGPKRYLSDFPDIAKTYIPERHLTQVKDDFGNILEVEDLLNDRLVLEDPNETRLQKLARRSVLMHSTPQARTLQRSMVAEFSYGEVYGAIQAVHDEINALCDLKVRESIAAVTTAVSMLLPVNSSALSPLPAAIPSVQVSPTSQGSKRYLKDFPDSAKTYIPEKRLTQVKDDFGNILEVANIIQDRLVLEDFNETRLQKLTRRYVLMNPSDPQAKTLQKSIEAEFPDRDEADRALITVYNEIHALYPPGQREAAILRTKLAVVTRGINDMKDLLDKHEALAKRDLIVFGIICSLVLVVAIVALLCFYALRFSSLYLTRLITISK